jgi:hypothetical protein
MTDQEKLVRDLIRSAFAGVTLGAGVGLREADGMDDYADEPALASLRARDEKCDWSAIPLADLDCCCSSLSYFDAEEMRFHLPAYLIADLEGTLNCIPLFTLFEARMDSRYKLLSPAQREAVREYLLLHLSDPRYEFNHPQIRAALETYWTAPGRS